MKLHLIYNPHAVRKLAKRKVWGQLAPPIYASDNDAIIRAMSLTVNIEPQTEQHTSLMPDQARDIIRYFEGT